MADCAGQILTIIKADESIMDSSAWIFCTIYNGEKYKTDIAVSLLT